jgi:glycerate kinase
MAEASGLALVPIEKRNPLITTSFGTGELMKRALDAGCKRLIVGIGGSATNDGGAGMAQALGIRLLDSHNREIGRGAQGLLDLDSIDTSTAHPRLQNAEILVACDVSNPLYGATGASYVYGPQKGARPEMLHLLDKAMVRLAETVERDLKRNVHDLPGGGAAGGLGAGLFAFTGGHLRPGIELVLEILNFKSILAEGADLLITGEGEINAQTGYGKVPFGVARLAKKYGIPVLALVGSIGPGSDDLFGYGIDAIMSIVPGPVGLEEAMARAGEMVRESSSRAMRMLFLFASREKL